MQSGSLHVIKRIARMWRQPLDCGGLTPLFLRMERDAWSIVPQSTARLRLPFAKKAKAASSRRTPKPRGAHTPARACEQAVVCMILSHAP